jgi:ATP synthase protein I
MKKFDTQKQKLTELSERIETAKKSVKDDEKKPQNHRNASIAWRMVVELVVGMIMGFGIGYGIDYIFDTAPLMIIIMSLFGFGAGIRTMIKTAEELK